MKKIQINIGFYSRLAQCLALGCTLTALACKDTLPQRSKTTALPPETKPAISHEAEKKDDSNSVKKDEDSGLLTDVKACEDIFELYALREANQQREHPSDAVAQAIHEKWSTLLANYKPQEIITGKVDFLTFEMRKSNEDGKCYGWWLFDVKQPMNSDYTLQLLGSVDATNLDKIPQRFRDWGYKYQPWNINPQPPTSQWQTSLHVVRAELEETQDIPYNCTLRFFYNEKDSQGKPIKQASCGPTLRLGWNAYLVE
ncbi:hypothetical protein JXA32_02740 [Candidatus Sumerlaeota bacterium]|nr:hypothetical protein [Candidatus Sumerlaeota bacterium]